MVIEIVNHSLNYSRLLAYQLSSLVLHRTGHGLVYSLFLDTNDAATVDVVDFFRPLMPANVTMKLWPMRAALLRNRHVGRNAAAIASSADWVWFTDTDYVFRDSIWDDLHENVNAGGRAAPFVWPDVIRETDWEVGDALIEQMNTVDVRDVPLESTYRQRMSKAIGGVQIVSGPVVRRLGYCPEYLQGESQEWNFRSDVAFRRRFSSKETVRLNHVGRIRHSRRGYGPDRPTEVFN